MKHLAICVLGALLFLQDSGVHCVAATAPKTPPNKLPLQFLPHERIALVGNSTAERMNLFGNFETLLHSRFPQLQLRVRNFARPCDAVDVNQRPSNYTTIDDPLR